MTRAAFTARLRDSQEAVATYERLHADVWPEVVADNENCGLHRVFIYRQGRTLFMFQEGDESYDPAGLGDALAAGHPRTREWITLMNGLMEQPEDGTPGPWRPLQEICALEGQPRQRRP